jgi:AmmeMemoRadiSam system protein B
MAKIRRPAVAGSFYEGDAEALKVQIENCFLHQAGPGKLPVVSAAGSRKVLGLVCPHAGYPYSGPVAAHAYFELASDGKPDTVVVLGPNHWGLGSGLAVVKEGFWRTPFGDVEVDSETADAILRETRVLDVDEVAHLREHSIEVQLPFLQFLYGDRFKFVPICFLMQDLQSAVEIGKALAEVLASMNAVVIASSDLTHYEPQATATRKDSEALKAVEKMDERVFLSTVEKQHISACGYGPIAALMAFAKGLGAVEAKVLKHATSGDVTGDYSAIVGYAAVSFRKKSG